MAEIDSLGANYYYSGVQNASHETIKRNTEKKEINKTGSSKKLSFEKMLKGKSIEEAPFITEGLPAEVTSMSIDDAAVYLADAVSMAGNDFSDQQTQENLEKFKTAVSQFIRFVVSNNFEVHNINSPKKRRPQQPPRLFVFSDYSLPPGKPRQKVSIEIINEKLNALANATLSNQMSNLKILEQVNEIKGLIVDLMSS